MPLPRKKMLKSFGSKKKTSTFAALFGEREAKTYKLGYGVIGNTTDSGPVIPGSSPGIPTKKLRSFMTSKFFLVKKSENFSRKLENVGSFCDKSKLSQYLCTDLCPSCKGSDVLMNTCF